MTEIESGVITVSGRRRRLPRGVGSEARRWTVAALSALVVVAAVGCAGPLSGSSQLAEGDCAVVRGEDGLGPADCAQPGALRVLAVRTQSEPCRDVAGVTLVRQDWGTSEKYCLGDAAVDPAAAVNTALVGDCLGPGGDAGPYARVDCADPAATVQVLHRVEDYAAAIDECDAIPGTTAEYEWRLRGEGLAQLSMDDIYFCLGPAGVDPRTFVAAARPGDCVRPTGGDPPWLLADCAAPGATQRVLDRDEGFPALVRGCRDTPGTTTTLTEDRRGTAGPILLCLGRI